MGTDGVDYIGNSLGVLLCAVVERTAVASEFKRALGAVVHDELCLHHSIQTAIFIC